MTVVILPGAATDRQRPVITSLVPADGGELVALHDRCSPETRYRRWHGHSVEFPRSYLAALTAGGGEQLAVVARDHGRAIGFASAARTAASTREIGILIEDVWQRHGVGRALLDALVVRCRRDGTRVLVAEVLADDGGLLAPLRRYGPVDSLLSHGVFRASLTL